MSFKKKKRTGHQEMDFVYYPHPQILKGINILFLTIFSLPLVSLSIYSCYLLELSIYGSDLKYICFPRDMTMFSMECIGYFSSSICLASTLGIFSKEYELVLHFGRKRERGEEWEMMD